MLNQNINLPADQIQRMQQMFQYYKYEMIMKELKKYSLNNSLNQLNQNFPNIYNLQPNPLINIPGNNYLVSPQMDYNSRQESLFSPNNYFQNITNLDMAEVYLCLKRMILLILRCIKCLIISNHPRIT